MLQCKFNLTHNNHGYGISELLNLQKTDSIDYQCLLS